MPNFIVCLPAIHEKSSRNWNFRWVVFCGTFTLAPVCTDGKSSRGLVVTLRISLVKSWKWNENTFNLVELNV